MFFKADIFIASLKIKALYGVCFFCVSVDQEIEKYLDHIDLVFKIKPKQNRYVSVWCLM